MSEGRRINSGLAKVRLQSPFGGGPQEALDVYDVSLRGLGLRLAIPLAAEMQVEIELTHPILDQPARLTGRVGWCRMVPGDPHPNAGIEFDQTTSLQRLALRLIQASEVSCRVVARLGTLGFVVVSGEQQWALYDRHTVKVATLHQEGRHFVVSFLGEKPEDSVHTIDAESLGEAVALALEIHETPMIVPPEAGHWVPIRPEAPQLGLPQGEQPTQTADATLLPGESTGHNPSRAFHAVLAGGYHVGFVAVTSVDDVWSLYDESWAEVALMSPHEGRFKISFVGKDPNDSLDYLIAKTFLGGIGLAFDLNTMPELDPPLVEAASQEDLLEHDKTQTAPPQHERPAQSELRRVLGEANAPVGYLGETQGMAGVYSAYSLEGERLAMIAPDEGRYRIMFMGTSPNESLDYMVARHVRGAVALVFELERLPQIDPPL